MVTATAATQAPISATMVVLGLPTDQEYMRRPEYSSGLVIMVGGDRTGVESDFLIRVDCPLLFQLLQGIKNIG